MDASFRAFNEVLSACIAQAGDVAHSLQAYLRHAEPDSELL